MKVRFLTPSPHPAAMLVEELKDNKAKLCQNFTILAGYVIFFRF